LKTGNPQERSKSEEVPLKVYDKARYKRKAYAADLERPGRNRDVWMTIAPGMREGGSGPIRKLGKEQVKVDLLQKLKKGCQQAARKLDRVKSTKKKKKGGGNQKKQAPPDAPSRGERTPKRWGDCRHGQPPKMSRVNLRA